MLLTFGIIFAFIWIVGVATGITFSGYIHLFLVASVMLILAHCCFPLRLGVAEPPSPDPLRQRRLARLLYWRPRRKKA
jgi:amino acid transporter